MPDIKKIQASENSLKTIGDFFSAYQKLTIYQMKKNRNATINSREYFNGLMGTFVDLKQDVKRLFKPKKTDPKILSFSTLSKNGKTVSVVLSFETKFSTETNRKTVTFFRENTQEKDTDLVIVGATAKRLFQESFPEEKNFEFFELIEEAVDLKQNIELLKHLLAYEQIDIYNPYYISLMQQQPQMDTISGDITLSDSKKTDSTDDDTSPQKIKRFLIEPAKETIMHFFEVQILSALFQHKIKETHLANLGSRIKTLQNTQDNLEREMEKLKYLKLKTLRKKANKKQRNRLSGMRFWMQ